MSAREGSKGVEFEKVEDALSQEICNYTNVVPIIKAVSQVDALVAVRSVIRSKRGQNAELDS